MSVFKKAVLGLVITAVLILMSQAMCMADQAVYGYDPLGRLSDVEVGERAEFEYDEVGNITFTNAPAVIRANPTDYNFGPWWTGHPSVTPLTVTIENPGLLNVLVTSVIINGTDAAEFELTGDDCSILTDTFSECNVTVTFKPASLGDKSATLVFETTSTVTPVIEVSLAGAGEEPPVGTPNVTMDDYTVVFTGLGYSTRTYTITNDAPTALKLYDVFVTNSVGTDEDEFVITSDNCSGVALASGESCTIEVMLDPLSEGDKDAILSFDTNMPGESNVEITLNGEGRDIEIASFPTAYYYGSHYLPDAYVVKEFEILNKANYGAFINFVGFLNVPDSDLDSFVISSDGCTGQVLQTLASCFVEVTFDPSSAGDKLVSLVVESDEPYINQILAVELTGSVYATKFTGVYPLAHDFSYVSTRETSNVKRFYFTHSNAIDRYFYVESTTLYGVDAGDFEIITDTCTRRAFSSGNGCYYDVVFKPGTAGEKTAKIDVTWGMSPFGSYQPTRRYTDTVHLTGAGYEANLVSIAPSAYDYKDVIVGGYRSGAYTLRNEGPGNITVKDVGLVTQDGFILESDGCKGAVLGSDDSCSMSVAFSPQAGGDASAALRVLTEDFDNPVINAELISRGVVASGQYLTPLSRDYGDVYVGAEVAKQAFTIRNDGDSALEIYSASIVNVSGTLESDFIVEYDMCSGNTLEPGASCIMDVVFAPGDYAGPRVARLEISTNQPDVTPAAELIGSGTLIEFFSTPTSYDFGSRYLYDPTIIKKFTITHAGNYDIDISSVGISTPEGVATNDYTVESDTCSGVALKPLESCDVEVSFTPQSGGAKEAVLQIQSSGYFFDTLALEVPLNGSAYAIKYSGLYPGSNEYGLVAVGDESPAKRFYFTHSGAINNYFYVEDMTFEGDTEDYTITVDTCTRRSFSSGRGCYYEIVFRPGSEGVKSATMNVTWGMSPFGSYRPTRRYTDSAILNGTAYGTNDISMEPSVYHYKDVIVGGSRTDIYLLSNAGPGDVKVNAVGLVDNGALQSEDFSFVTDNCSGKVLIANSTCDMTVAFLPLAEGEAGAILRVLTADPDTPVVDSILGGVAIAASGNYMTPLSHDFDEAYVGVDVLKQAFTVRNDGGTNLVITGTSISNVSGTLDGDFTIDYDECSGTSLASGESCIIDVAFTPQDAGPRTARLDVSTGSAGISPSAELTGKGTKVEFISTPSSYDYGTRYLQDPTVTRRFTVTHLGDYEANVSAVKVTDTNGVDTGDYSIISDTCTGVSLGRLASCEVEVSFTPQTKGLKDSTLNIETYGDFYRLLTFRIPLYGNAYDTIYSGLSPLSYAFGNIPVGEESPLKRFYFRHSGAINNYFYVEEMVFEGDTDDFTIVTDSCTRRSVSSGRHCVYDVVFNPVTEGDKSASIKVTWGMSPFGSYRPNRRYTDTISLTGTGYTAGSLSLQPVEFHYGTLPVGVATGPTNVFTVTNEGLNSVEIEQAGIVQAGLANSLNFEMLSEDCSGQVLIANATCQVEVAAHPTKGGLNEAELVVLTSSADMPVLNATLIADGYEPPKIFMVPGSYDFGVTPLDVSPEAQMHVYNIGIGNLIVNSVGFINGAEFSITEDNCTGRELTLDERCGVQFKFNPVSVGDTNDILRIYSSDPAKAVVDFNVYASVAAYGVTVAPDSHYFGNVDVNSSSTSTDFIITNQSITPVVINSVGFTDTVDFALLSTTCSNSILATGESCTVKVAFTPYSKGTKVGTMRVLTDDAEIGWVDVSLSGYGVFDSAANKVLTIKRSGMGTVTSYPAGIDCGVDCSQAFSASSTVALTAQATEGYEFLGWSGGMCSGIGDCIITLDADSSVNAVFSSPSQKLDMAFVIDTSGSMWDDIAKIKAMATEMILSIDSTGADYRVAVVDYRDYPVDPYGSPGDYPYQVVQPFTNDPLLAIEAIENLTLGNSLDSAEAVYTALMNTMSADGTGQWRQDAERTIILIGDAPPHDPEPFTGYTLNSVLEAANTALQVTEAEPMLEFIRSALASIFVSKAYAAENGDGLMIYSVLMGSDPVAEEYFSTLAEGTGGKPFQAPTAPDIVSSLLEVVDDIFRYSGPVCDGATASQTYLWPPNHKMVDVNVWNVTDSDNDPVMITITGITQDEPVLGRGSGNTTPDAYGVGTDTASLRSERMGGSDGRVYKIDFTASSVDGQCFGSVLVCASHDQGDNVACVDSGQTYNSDDQ